MFDIGLQEMLVIGVIALLVFGPSRLPELGRMVGRAMREFRRASDEFRSTVETNLNLNDSDPVIHTTPSTPEPATTATATTLPSELEPTHASADDSVVTSSTKLAPTMPNKQRDDMSDEVSGRLAGKRWRQTETKHL